MIILDLIAFLSFVSAVLFFIKSAEKKDLLYLASGMSRSYLSILLILSTHFHDLIKLGLLDFEVSLIVILVTDVLATSFYLVGKKYILEIEYSKTVVGLKNLTEKISIVMEGSVTPYFRILMDGTIEMANSALARLLEIPRHELVGKNLFEFLTPECKEDILTYNTFHCANMRLVTNTGKVLDTYVSGGKTRNGHDSITGSIVKLN